MALLRQGFGRASKKNMKKYSHRAIERKWQREWMKKGIYRSKEKGKKSYILDMFPYPSGEGLHVGHPKGYIATDVYSRMKRMHGRSVLHPMGWDAFGLPAENFAIKNKIHPRKAVEKNIKRFKEQLGMIGLDYDWSREINTTDPNFYKWTQWIFLQLYKKGLAYESHEPINWCPSCQTGLANEDLEGGVCERCGSEVVQRPMRQWVLKITDYADRLLEDLSLLPEWQEHIKESQRNWIGRSEGAEIDFKLTNGEKVTVFTTRADTLFGATYIVLAPEHPLIAQFCASKACTNRAEIEVYVKQAAKKSDLERQAEQKDKTGVELKGIKATNPATGEEIPVWVADYVLGHYGTGAIMAVPAHDERDGDFAKKFNLPIKQVIAAVSRQKNGNDAWRENEPIKLRNAVMCIVKHWEKNEYLCLQWKEHPDIRSFISGGIEEGESPEDAGKREILEESGYKNPKFVRRVGNVSYTEFYHQVKKTNVRARFTYLYYELENGERDAIAAEEEKIHDMIWKKENEVHDFLSLLERDAIWLGFQGKIKEEAFTENGILINSGEYDGFTSDEAKEKLTKKFGRPKKTYKIRDWVFSRQRYWGEPIPMIHCEKCGTVPVPEKDLPVKLPDVKKYEPTGTGESPLAAIDTWVHVKCPKCKGKAKRETNTMPQWAGSSWYYLRYMDPKNKKALVDKKKEKFWAPVDLYVGGAEHATRHLIYARFWHKFLYDIKAVSTKEPFTRLISVGLIMAEDGRKMSKRYGNVINPDDVIKTYGADTLRVYEMFMGPFADSIAWNTNSMIGARRFLERLWRASNLVGTKEIGALEPILHKTIKKVGEDIESFKFNTAISALMVLLNAVEKEKVVGKKQWETILKLVAPFAPHIAEELWRKDHPGRAGRKSIHLESWPKYSAKKIVEDTVVIAIQINGKARGEVRLAANASREETEEAAQEAMKERLAGKEIRRIVVVPGRIVNFVVSE